MLPKLSPLRPLVIGTVLALGSVGTDTESSRQPQSSESSAHSCPPSGRTALCHERWRNINSKDSGSVAISAPTRYLQQSTVEYSKADYQRRLAAFVSDATALLGADRVDASPGKLADSAYSRAR